MFEKVHFQYESQNLINKNFQKPQTRDAVRCLKF